METKIKEITEMYWQPNISPFHLELLVELGFRAGRQEGIREVVEWLKKNMKHPKDCGDGTYYYLHLTVGEWQDKLKEWGIE